MTESLQTLAPGFMVVHGNRMEDLRALAVEWMRRHPLAPLENETLLVQSNGVAQWLKMALARSPEAGGCGIAAALDIQLPARFLWSAYQAVLGPGEVPAQSPFARDALAWRLMGLLPELLADPLYAPLARFLEDDTDLRKRHQLAVRLADLFDQYQVYRADWLADWAAGDDRLRDASGRPRELEPELRWQPALWRALLEDAGPLLAGQARSALHRRFLEAVAGLRAPPPGLPRRVIVFGISSLPAQSLEALEALARLSQLLVCVHNPCEYYWADLAPGREAPAPGAGRRPRRSAPAADPDAHGHPLLAAWGRQGQDYIRLLDERDRPEAYRALLEALPWERIDLFEPHGQDCLLHQLQDDIRELRPLQETRAHWPALDPADTSIQFHVTHSPQREVEVLHDQLLARFDADPSLRPRDVIVMVPDVDAYAPHVQAVFGRLEPDDSRHIPFALSDQGARGRDPLLAALEALLGLPHARLGVSELLDLLEVPAVCRRFGIPPQRLAQLHDWVAGAGIRWGLHAPARAALGLPDGLQQNTWRFGLSRLLLGYASAGTGPWQGIEPHAEVGGLEARLLGPLAQLLERLEHWWQRLREPVPAARWGERLRALLADFFEPDADAEQLTLARLAETLEQWEQACALAGLEQPLPLGVVAEHWLAAQDGASLSGRFLGGAVSVCTLLPMRAIPFRVVCLLGMNDGDYPRVRVPADFDLMAGEHRPGDRSRREDDRYLFLEALLSAREQLYVSWVGRSARDDSARPPSVLVAQLRDHLAAGWQPAAGDAGEPSGLLERLTLVHPLQPFGRAYFRAGGDPRCFTYAAEWSAVHAAPAPAGDAPAAPLAPRPAPAPLAPEALARFLKNPVQAFFNQRLEVFFDDPDEMADDLEPFTLDALTAWQLRERLTAAVLADAGGPAAWEGRLDAELARLGRSGELPLGGAAAADQEALGGAVLQLLGRYREWLASYPEERVEPELHAFERAGVVVEGWQPALRRGDGGRLLRLAWRPGPLARDDGSRRLDACCGVWVDHLLGNAAGPGFATTLVGTDAALHFPALAAERAAQVLEGLLAGWAAGQTRPPPVTCRSACAWLEAEAAGRDPESAAARVYDGAGRRPGEAGRSPYLARVYASFQDLLADGDFPRLVETLYRPLWAAAGEGGP